MKPALQTLTKVLGQPVVKSSGAPDAAQLAAIRTYTLRDFTAEELVVREFALAHNAVDRDGEVFSEGVLSDFVRTIPGKSVHIRHPSGWDGDSGPGEGRVFGARIVRMSHDAARTLLREPDMQWPPDHMDAVLLMVDAYYVRTPENEAFLLKLDAGIAGEVSIGFAGGRTERVKGPDDIELNVWRWQGPAEAREMSHVWLGAQPGARATKSAPRNPNPEESEMDKDEEKQLRDDLAQAKATAEASTKASAALDAIRKALGDSAALLDQPADLAAAVSAGISYRKALVDDLVTAERHAGVTGDTDDEIKAAVELFNALPVEKLKALVTRYAAPMAQHAQLRGGDPNANAPGAGGVKAPEGSPAANPMFTS